MSRKFLLDANAFIEPRNRYYSFDICPGYWDALIQLHEKELVFSLDRIRDELVPKKKKEEWDDIAKWIDEEVSDSFFKKTGDQAVEDSYSEMMRWAFSETQFTPAAKAEFASAAVADGWLVAYAAVNGHIVVTHETYSPDIKRRIKIPNVCEEFDVGYVNTFEMLRETGVKFVLSPEPRRKGK